jgi:hypothetical protein
MNVAVITSATRRCRIARITEIQEDEPTATGGIPRTSANDICEASLVISKDIVGTAVGEVAVETGKVLGRVECDGTFAVVDA